MNDDEQDVKQFNIMETGPILCASINFVSQNNFSHTSSCYRKVKGPGRGYSVSLSKINLRVSRSQLISY